MNKPSKNITPILPIEYSTKEMLRLYFKRLITFISVLIASLLMGIFFFGLVLIVKNGDWIVLEIIGTVVFMLIGIWAFGSKDFRKSRIYSFLYREDDSENDLDKANSEDVGLIKTRLQNAILNQPHLSKLSHQDADLKPLRKMSKKTHKEIRELLSKGRNKQALKLLQELLGENHPAIDNIISIRGSLAKLERDITQGLITDSEYQIELNKNVQSIFKIIDYYEPLVFDKADEVDEIDSFKETIEIDFRAKILELVAEWKLKPAIEELIRWINVDT